MTIEDAVSVLMLYRVDEMTARKHCEGMDLRSIPIREQLDKVKKVGQDFAERERKSHLKAWNLVSYNNM